MEVFNHVEQHRIDEFFEFNKKHLKYPIKAITKDLHEMLEKSILNTMVHSYHIRNVLNTQWM